MSMFALVLVALLAAVPGVVLADLWRDVPRLAIWFAKRAESMLRPQDRRFYAWASEVEQASTEAAEGRRSKLSVLAMASGTLVAAIRVRLRSRNVAPALVRQHSSDLVKVHIPTLLDEGFQSEGVWAEWVGEDDRGDLYRLENHVVFSDLACCGDIVRTTFHPLEDRPGYGWLKFAEVVEEARYGEVRLWHKWRLFKQHRYARLHRDLHGLGMTSEWMSGTIGTGTMPDGSAGKKAARLLRRRRVCWEPVERVRIAPHELPILELE